MTDHDSKAPRYAEGPTNADILQAVQKVSERVGKIETALYGTGNPHGGLCGEFEALTTKVDGMDKKLAVLSTKVDGMDKNFDRMFSFAKWTVGGLFIIFAVPIFLKSFGRLSKRNRKLTMTKEEYNEKQEEILKELRQNQKRCRPTQRRPNQPANQGGKN